MIKKISALGLFIFLMAGSVYADGTKWDAFKKNLKPFFGDDLINDISNHEPLIANYTVYSWDVGDFSGDGYSDLAMSVKTPTTRGRNMKVLFFADIDGYLEKVGELEKQYVDLPLEVGVAVREGAVFITEKQRQFEWEIKGYSLINGEFLKVEDFETKSAAGITNESSIGYKNRPSRIRILESSNNKLLFDYKYLVSELASGSRNPLDHSPYLSRSSDVNGISEGAYWWESWDDLSFEVSFSYRDGILIADIDVTDDKVLTAPYYESIDIALATGEVIRKPNKVGARYVLPEPKVGITALSFIPFGTGVKELDEYVEVNSADNKNLSFAINTEKGYRARVYMDLQQMGIDTDKIEQGGELFYHVTVHDRDDPENRDRVTSFGNTDYSSGNPLYWNTLKLPQEPLTTLSQKRIRILKEYGY